ncbi:MAG: multiheme c-type cytochrome [Rhodothermales bacterium]
MKRTFDSLSRWLSASSLLLLAGIPALVLLWAFVAPQPVELVSNTAGSGEVQALLVSDVVPARATASGVETRLLRGGDDDEPMPSSLLRAWLDAESGSIRGRALVQQIADSAHNVLLLEERFPSANACQTCHPDQYREWSVSSHAYAQLSPVFNAMHGTIVKLTNGTNGDFCIRCHTQVGMNLGEDVFMSNMDRNPTSREGITCIVCHRVKNAYSKISGRFAIVEGDIFDPVFGPDGEAELDRVIGDPDFNVNTQRGASGRAIHTGAIQFEQIGESSFCGACHDVNLVNGFRLEEAFSEYKATPASKRGVSCQDCHMGSVPGEDKGYDQGPAAIVGGKPTAIDKRTNHRFAGPDHSIIHPGLFPQNVRANDLATMREWLTFDVAAGWGTDEFEDNVPEGYEFPPRWSTADDRYDAREVLEENFAALAEINVERYAVLRAGYVLGDVEVDRAGPDGIAFNVEFRNGTDGHNVPTGFDAERLVFLQVTVTDADDRVVFQSGDRDPNGDVRDLHSIYVHNGELPLDKYLFNLQSKFVTKMIRGGDREQVLAVNYSPSPLPFLRPSTSSTVLLGRPTNVRKHRQTLPPNHSEWPEYVVSRSELAGSRPPYKANVKLIAQMVPVNLIDEIQHVGFDYFMSPRTVADRIVEGALTLYDRDVELRPSATWSEQRLPGPTITSRGNDAVSN